MFYWILFVRGIVVTVLFLIVVFFIRIDRLPLADKYRIVSIKGVNAIPCTGTHVRNTDEVGRIVIDNVDVLDKRFKLFYNVS